MTHHYIKVDIDGPVASLCVAALKELGDEQRVRAILVRGEGRAFSAGFDMKASAARDMSTVEHVRHQMERQFDFIIAFWDCPKPTIALVHGFCMAGALSTSSRSSGTYSSTPSPEGEELMDFERLVHGNRMWDASRILGVERVSWILMR